MIHFHARPYFMESVVTSHSSSQSKRKKSPLMMKLYEWVLEISQYMLCQNTILTTGNNVNVRENMQRNEVREGTIAIAVDKDKRSCNALRWAVEHYIPRGGSVKLVHVIQRSQLNAIGPYTDDELSERQHNDNRRTQFLSLLCLCTRKNIQSEVVFLEDQNVAKALIEYISKNCISTLLLGASLKKSITRLFKVDDIPSNVMRWAPDFCSVLVISKGRVSSVRSATRPLPQALPSSSGTRPLSPCSNTTNDEAPSEMLLSREDDLFFEEFPPFDTDCAMNISDRNSTDSSVLSFYENLGAPHMLEIPRLSGLDDEKAKFSICLDSPSDERKCTLASPQPQTDDAEAEAEKKRLKKELKETTNMYQAACKEALMEKEKAEELENWKKKTEQRLQMAEETATMAITKMEKKKLEVQRRVEEETKAMRGRENDDRKMALESPGESHIVVKYVSLLHISAVLFFFYFYFTLR